MADNHTDKHTDHADHGSKQLANNVDKDSLFTNYAPITSRAFATSLILELLGASTCMRLCSDVLCK
jgi:hypothetical protein